MRRSLKSCLFAVVLLGLVAGVAAYFAAEKSLTLTVDGQSRLVTTYAGTAAEVLADEGLTPAAHDVVLPALGTDVNDGDTIVVNRARPLTLTVDGVRSEVVTTALSVDDALDQLGYRTDQLQLSADRSERLPLDGMDLAITTSKDVRLVADGHERVVTTTAATAGDLLAEQGIALSATDRTSLYPAQPLLGGMVLRVTRVQVEEVTEVETIDYETVETEDAEALEGERTVTQEGVEGARTTTWRVTVTDGVETGREQVSSAVTEKPVEQQVSVGTKPEPEPAPAAVAAGAPATADGLNWAALARCESGGRPNAVSASGTYRGMYQFSRATWAGVGGSGDPAAASVEEQTMRAQMLYARSGAGQWGCGSHLFD
ncbi:ubiquitin-like domain-containing protein [Modestobacter sp. VKM Ac-2986]|uniref:resuscitation-promoting factor n=1 Tax=Modestobacter sp. VKM Ac-2986 TaxID=3004140 RepID=UPI0022ABBACC|nr:resuscitation-promoting factor [Modestobacter sp. VKM Ac-2986]MCZ2830207.1 ubiquitin-like domain-containing protein [Modestobacter sp. VKM Ac-2986]